VFSSIQFYCDDDWTSEREWREFCHATAAVYNRTQLSNSFFRETEWNLRLNFSSLSFCRRNDTHSTYTFNETTLRLSHHWELEMCLCEKGRTCFSSLGRLVIDNDIFLVKEEKNFRHLSNQKVLKQFSTASELTRDPNEWQTSLVKYPNNFLWLPIVVIFSTYLHTCSHLKNSFPFLYNNISENHFYHSFWTFYSFDQVFLLFMQKVF